MNFKLFEEVVLKRGHAQANLKQGDLATIVEVVKINN